MLHYITQYMDAEMTELRNKMAIAVQKEAKLSSSYFLIFIIQNIPLINVLLNTGCFNSIHCTTL